MVDFNKHLGTKKRLQKPLRPADIYETLDLASDKGPLRPAQEAVLEDWHTNRRQLRDVIVKLHTGQGKTLIGMLALQSKLNEGAGPAVYLCPNNFLVDQTVAQARQFGLHCVKADPDLPAEFLDSSAILITSVQKMFNGLTRFRLGPQSQSVGALVMDDSHACIDAIRDASVIRLPHGHRVYHSLRALFAGGLKEQGAGTFADIELERYGPFLPVPYWDWMDRHEDAARILAKDGDTNELKYVWPLLKDVLRDCTCIVSGTHLEIAPQLPPLHLFGSFANSRHRMFMSATVTNDAFLVKGLGLTPDIITKPLVYKDEKWSGEKMILVPSLIHPSLDRDRIIKDFAKPVAKRSYGAVVLTPSFARADDWKKEGATVADKNTIHAEIERLKAGNGANTLVIANRYDGIDLPDEACRLLIMDSLPYSENLTDRWTEACRPGSDVVLTRIARTVEQGLGRAVRGERDYCAVMLTGPDLVNAARTKKMQSFFSPQTRAQIDIGLEVAEFAKEEAEGSDPVAGLKRLILQCLKRDEGWKAFYSGRMSDITFGAADPKALEIFAAEQVAETEFQNGRPEAAVKAIQKLVDQHITQPGEKGWYLQEMARYTHLTSKTDSNELQIHAHKQNRYLLKPRQGMKVTTIAAAPQKRVERMIDWARSFESSEELLLAVEDILSRLRFGVQADLFEGAVDELGIALGFATQRPDKEWKEGPDNLWGLRDTQYLLIECKNQVEEARTEIHKQETGQMNNSCAWFKNNYPGAVSKNIMIIWTKAVAPAAGFNEDLGIMRGRQLEMLVKNVRSFFQELRGVDLKDLSETKLKTLLDTHQLTVDDLLTKYSEAPEQH
jgi:replicative superfamily II helicase